MSLFLDTSAVVALYNEDDDFHAEALDVMARIERNEIEFTRFYITDYVFDEAMTFLECVVRDHALAVEVGEALLNSPHVVIEQVGEGLFQASWGRFRESEGLSFTDCVSFSFMREKGVTRAFTFDDHFRREKFETVP